MGVTAEQSSRLGVRAAGPWVAVALLGVVAGLLIAQLFAAPPALAQTGSAEGHASSVFAIAGQLTRDTYGLYLVDVPNSTICVYQYLPIDRRFRLMAARTFLYDRQLDSYNSDSPTPAEVRDLVAEARRVKEVPPRPATGPATAGPTLKE